MAGLALLRGDLSRMSRGTRAHLARLAFVGALALFTAIAWPWHARPGTAISGEPLLRVFVWCEILAAAFLVPAFVAPAVASERERGTLDILVACPHTEGGLVAGRGLSQGMWAISLLAAGAPFAIIAVVIGGAPPWRAAVGLLHALFAGLFSVIVSLAASVRAKTAAEATTSAFVWMLGTAGVGAVVSYTGLALLGPRSASEWIIGFFLIGAALLVFGIRFRVHLASAIGAILFGLAGLTSWFAVSVPFFGGGPRVPRFTIDNVVACLCPWVSSLVDLSDHPLQDEARFLTWGSYAAFSALALFALVRHVRRHGLLVNPDPMMAAFQGWNPRPPYRPKPSTGPARANAVLPPHAVVQHRMAVAGADEVLWKARKQRGSALPVRGNPVFWKDSKILKNPASGCLIALTVAICGLLTLPSIIGCAEGRHSGLAHSTLLVDLVFLGLLVASLCGSLFAAERSERTLPVLLSTGFPAGDVVAGKLLAALWHLRAPLVLTALRLFILLVDSPQPGAVVLVVMATSLAGLAGVSIAISALVPNSRASAALALAAGFVMWMGPSLVGVEMLSPFEFIPYVLRWNESSKCVTATGMAAVWCIAQSALAAAGWFVAAGAVEKGRSA